MKTPPFPPGAIVEGNDIAIIDPVDFESPGVRNKWLEAGVGPEGQVAGVRSFSLPRVGPAWFDFRSSPATREIGEQLPPGLIE